MSANGCRMDSEYIERNYDARDADRVVLGAGDEDAHDVWQAAIEALRDELSDSSDDCGTPEPF